MVSAGSDSTLPSVDCNSKVLDELVLEWLQADAKGHSHLTALEAVRMDIEAGRIDLGLESLAHVAPVTASVSCCGIQGAHTPDAGALPPWP